MFPSKGSRQCSSSQPLYTNISPTSSKTFVPAGAFGFTIFCLSLITLLAPVPSINIGQGSPPKLTVVDISQLGLSLCLCRQYRLFYKLLHKSMLDIRSNPVCCFITGNILTIRVSIAKSP